MYKRFSIIMLAVALSSCGTPQQKASALEENKEFVRINNVETLAQVFTDIRYTKKDCEAMSQGFLEAIKQQGFI